MKVLMRLQKTNEKMNYYLCKGLITECEKKHRRQSAMYVCERDCMWEGL